jgi:hypothetical protein
VTDPFDALRHHSPNAVPDADYVERVMSDVARRLDAPVQQEALPIRPHTDFLEIVPMHKSSRRRRPPLVVALTAVAAVAALVAVVMLRNDPSSTPTPSATTPPAATATTTPAAAATPQALQGRWTSDTRSFLAGGAGVSLKIDNDSLSLSAINLNDYVSLSGVVRAAEEGVIVVSSRSTSTTSITCPSTAQEGSYTWKLSASGRQLDVAVKSDQCAARAAALVGSYWRMGCINTKTNCLGLLDAGTYASQYIRPFQTGSSGWSARYGGVRYTVPDGWANFQDAWEIFGLSPATDFSATTADQTTPVHSLFVLSPVAPITGACETPKLVISKSLEEAVAALSTTPGITVSPPLSMTVDGHRAVAVDVGPNPTACANGSTRALLGGELTDSTRAIALDTNEKVRIILVDLRDGAIGENGIQLASIWIDASDGYGFDQFVTEAMKIVDTMHFT